MNRRDLIKWVLYLSATAAIPEIAATLEKFPHDVLEGMSRVEKRMADLSGNAPAYRAAEDDAFEEVMRETWRAQNGRARYIRVFQDLALQPARDYKYEDGTVVHEPKGYVSFFQYRRA